MITLLCYPAIFQHKDLGKRKGGNDPMGNENQCSVPQPGMQITGN
jgi:hypothetical protein